MSRKIFVAFCGRPTKVKEKDRRRGNHEIQNHCDCIMPHSGFAAPKTKVAVTEIREITYKGELVGRPEVKVEHADGTYTTTVPLQLPSSAQKGTYKVKAMVESQYAKDAREITFTVR